MLVDKSIQNESLLDRRVSDDDVESLFQIILKRPSNDAEYVRTLVERGVTVRQLLTDMRNCEELENKFRLHLATKKKFQNVAKMRDLHLIEEGLFPYRVPNALQLTELSVNSVAIIGSCEANEWVELLKK